MQNIKNYLGGTQRTLNEINISVVLDRIRNRKNSSRSSLAKELNLSSPSISRIVKKLIDSNYIYEDGFGNSSGGKKPVILKFKSDRSYVIGIGVDIDYIELMLSDLSGNEKEVTYEEFPKNKQPKEVIKVIVDYVKKIIRSSGVKDEKVKVISIGVPAMVESKTGLLNVCPTIPVWEGINLSKILANEMKKVVLVDNVANMAILGESWKGISGNCNNVILIAIGTGIGAGILLNGRLYHGSNGSAGEIGYMYIDRKLKKQESEPFGQFEYLASNTALRKKDVKVAFGGKVLQNFKYLLNEKDGKKEVILELLDNLAFGISNLIAVLNPELIIIRGALFHESEFCFNYLQKKVKELSPFNTKLTLSSLKYKDVVYGAVHLALNYLDRTILSPFFYK